MKKKDVIEKIRGFLDGHKWKYSYNKEKQIFSLGFCDVHSKVNNVQMFIVFVDDYFKVYTILQLKIFKGKYSKVSEYLHRVNLGLNEGNFEFDLDCGEIRYKTYTNFGDNTISDLNLYIAMIMGIIMIEKYGYGLIDVLSNKKTPSQALDASEEKRITQQVLGSENQTV